MSVYQEFLIWSCSIGDEALLDIFWKRTPNPIKHLDDEMPAVYAELLKNVEILEEHFKDIRSATGQNLEK